MKPTYSAKVSETSSQMIGLTVERSACSSCNSGCKGSLEMHLPSEVVATSLRPVVGMEIEVRITLKTQMSLLVNSLLLPLTGFLFGSGIAAFFNPSDVVVMIGALTGFVSGVFLCKRGGFDLIQAMARANKNECVI